MPWTCAFLPQVVRSVLIVRDIYPQDVKFSTCSVSVRCEEPKSRQQRNLIVGTPHHTQHPTLKDGTCIPEAQRHWRWSVKTLTNHCCLASVCAGHCDNCQGQSHEHNNNNNDMLQSHFPTTRHIIMAFGQSLPRQTIVRSKNELSNFHVSVHTSRRTVCSFQQILFQVWRLGNIRIVLKEIQ